MVCLLVEALRFPEANLWYVAPFRQQAKEIAWELLKKISPKGEVERINESELYIQYRNGSRISVKGADNEESLVGVFLGCKNHIGGLGAVIDEVALIRDVKKVIEVIVGPMLLDTQAGLLYIGTPRGKDFLWELFNKGQSENYPDYESWQYTSYDNPMNSKKWLDNRRLQIGEREFAQEHLASFLDFKGIVYPEFKEKEHVITPHALNPKLSKIGAIDTAITGVTGVLKAVVETDGTMTIYDEYYEADKRVNEVVPEIKEEDVTWYIDPAAVGQKIQRQGKLFTLYDEYQDHGIHALYAEKNVEGGINRVAEMFASGKIKIFSSCVNLIWELERYHWSEQKETNKGIIKPAPYKKNDHLVDDLRYLVMSREITRIEDKKEEPGVWSPAFNNVAFGTGQVEEEKFV